MRYRTLWAPLGFALGALGGCGGGGGGTSTLPSFPGEAAINAYLQVAHHSTLSAVDSAGNNYTLQVDRVPSASTSMFNGSLANSTEDTATLTKGSAPPTITQSITYFLLNPYVPLGKDYGTLFGGCFFCSVRFHGVVTSSFPLPVALMVGDSGAVANLTYTGYLPRPGVPTLDGYETVTYSVSATPASTLSLLCLDSAISLVTPQGMADGFSDIPETDCYTISASGTATLVSVAKSVGGLMLTFK